VQAPSTITSKIDSTNLYVLISLSSSDPLVSIFLFLEVVRTWSATLHTPVMSRALAISSRIRASHHSAEGPRFIGRDPSAIYIRDGGSPVYFSPRLVTSPEPLLSVLTEGRP
jgi:hypothetical protein